MKGARLNRLHRGVGLVIAPFLVLQTLSGLVLDFGLFRRGAGGTPALGQEEQLDLILEKIHFGPGWLGDSYHLLLGTATVWMALSGWLLFLRLRRNRQRLAVEPPAGQSGTK